MNQQSRPIVPRSVHELAQALHRRIAEDEARKQVRDDLRWAHAKVRWTIGNAVLMDASGTQQ